MTVLETTTITDRVTDFVTEEGDHDKEAHIVVPKSAVTEAMITGTPCRALCGKLWTPTRAADPFPVCKLCIEAFEAITGQVWEGRR